MAGALAGTAAEQLRAAVNTALRGTSDIPATAVAALARLVDVLESNEDAVVFAADETISTQQAAALLGVSRMTVVRLIDKGELGAEPGGVHRRVSVSELARYQAASSRRRRAAIVELAEDIGAHTPPDEVIETR